MAVSNDTLTIQRALMAACADLLIEVAQVARHAPRGITDSALTPGWYFSTTLDPGMAVADRRPAESWRLRNFITIFEKTVTGRTARFALDATYDGPSREVSASWVALNAGEGARDLPVTWDAIWQTLLFDD